MARPRRFGPAKSIFMITVVDQVSPWLMPRSALATIIQPQLGAHINNKGTGMAMAQPISSKGRRPILSERVPAA